MRFVHSLPVSCIAALLCAAAPAQAGNDAAARVTSALAVAATRGQMIEASGALVPWEEAIVAARLSGVPITDDPARVGDAVSKGDVLARFDDAPARAALARAEAVLEQDRASAVEAASVRDRALALRASGGLSEQDIVQAVAKSQVAEARRKQSEALLQQARLDLDYTRVLAPDSGVISSRSVALGAVPVAGAELFRLIRQGRMEWRAELGSEQLALCRPGQHVRVVLPGGQALAGTIRRVSPALNPNTRLGTVYAALDTREPVRANDYVHGTIEAAQRQVTMVPSASVVLRDGKSYVVALSASRAHLVPVALGERGPDFTEVLSGVDAGQPVIVRGAGFLTEGSAVQVIAAPPLRP